MANLVTTRHKNDIAEENRPGLVDQPGLYSPSNRTKTKRKRTELLSDSEETRPKKKRATDSSTKLAMDRMQTPTRRQKSLHHRPEEIEQETQRPMTTRRQLLQETQDNQSRRDSREKRRERSRSRRKKAHLLSEDKASLKLRSNEQADTEKQNIARRSFSPTRSLRSQYLKH